MKIWQNPANIFLWMFNGTCFLLYLGELRASAFLKGRPLLEGLKTGDYGATMVWVWLQTLGSPM